MRRPRRTELWSAPRWLVPEKRKAGLCTRPNLHKTPIDRALSGLRPGWDSYGTCDELLPLCNVCQPVFQAHSYCAAYNFRRVSKRARVRMPLVPSEARSARCNRRQASHRGIPLFYGVRSASRARLDRHRENAGRTAMTAPLKRNHAAKAPAELINIWHSA